MNGGLRYDIRMDSKETDRAAHAVSDGRPCYPIRPTSPAVTERLGPYVSQWPMPRARPCLAIRAITFRSSASSTASVSSG